jgi:acyl-CoA synthetase (AMP-forming)/AMP-acid ligase II
LIEKELAEKAAMEPERIFLSWPEGRLSYSESQREAQKWRASHPHLAGRAVGLIGRPDPSFFISLIALDGLCSRIYCLPDGLDSQDLEALAKTYGFSLVESERAAASPAAPPMTTPESEVVLFTSGTTGTPKAALHTWASLSSRIHVSPAVLGARWLLTYNPAAFAGLQVFLHVLRNAGQLCFGAVSAAHAAEWAGRQAVTHISATPTFFRWMLATAERSTLNALALRQITLGGEAVDQNILDALKRQFPSAQVTHIYASTEGGVCFSVHDGQAGFPKRLLDPEGGPARLRVVDGELQVRAAGAMTRYLGEDRAAPSDGYFPTGDLVRVEDERVFFLGRKSERINVGGNKLFPEEVEHVLLGIPGILGARVFGAPSSLTGQIVGAEIVLRPGTDPNQARPEILALCRKALPPFKVPRALTFVEHLEMKSGKLARR